MSSGYRLRVSGDLASFVRKLHPQIKRKVRAGLDDILTDPACGKPLKLELAGLWSYRIGRFRIIYRIGEQKVIELVTIGPRKNIYEETYRLMAKQLHKEG